MLDEENTKFSFPELQERSLPIWQEALLGLAIAYIAGIGSILTYERWATILAWGSAAYAWAIQLLAAAASLFYRIF